MLGFGEQPTVLRDVYFKTCRPYWKGKFRTLQSINILEILSIIQMLAMIKTSVIFTR